MVSPSIRVRLLAIWHVPQKKKKKIVEPEPMILMIKSGFNFKRKMNLDINSYGGWPGQNPTIHFYLQKNITFTILIFTTNLNDILLLVSKK